MLTDDMIVSEIAREEADKIFDALSDYGRWRLSREGTAFTTYEEHGEDVCAALNHRARVWYAYQVETGGFNCRLTPAGR